MKARNKYIVTMLRHTSAMITSKIMHCMTCSSCCRPPFYVVMAKKTKSKLRAPLPIIKAKVRSQKHGRVVTSQYHKYTAQRDAAREEGRMQDVQAAEAKLVEIGGVDAYQEASAVSTALHSTSKWVVKALRAKGLTKPPSSGLGRSAA